MKISEYNKFIPQNVAPQNAVQIGLYNRNNKRLGGFELQNLKRSFGTKLYTFESISDVHIDIDTAESDFRKALNYAQDNVDFVCIAGDLTNMNTDEQWELYKSITDEYTIPIHAISGNHDCYGSGISDAKLQLYTGHGLHYSFEKENDVFIMIGEYAWASQSGGIQPFYNISLQFLYNTLEANRNKRCFVFIHVFPWGKAGDPFELYSSNALFGTQGTLIYNLMQHYKNAIWFHGHSHQKFDVQCQHDKANYDFDFGVHNIHIPSVTKPVDIINGQRVAEVSGSQGYIVDVYENNVVLKGMNFVNESVVPLAVYNLDTTLKNVDANTFTDNTGIITNS